MFQVTRSLQVSYFMAKEFVVFDDETDVHQIKKRRRRVREREKNVRLQCRWDGLLR